MASLRIIWKFHSRSFATLLFGCAPFFSLADCLPLPNGIYVADADSDARLDGGRWPRVKEQLTRPNLDNRFKATTFHFSNAIVVVNGKITLYRLISNAPDPGYESLSIRATVEVTNDCSGRLKLDFQVDSFYPNEIALGITPNKSATRLTYPLKVHQEGYILPEGHWRITVCQAQELRKRGWRDTRDDLGLCSGPRHGYTLFDIQKAIHGRKEWRALDRPQ